MSTTGKSQPSAPGSTILLQPSISDISFGGGAAYYPLLRKEGFTPVLAFETGYHIVSETVKVIDQLVGREDSFSNSILFQNISISIGAEFQMDPRTSLQARGRVNLNIPIGRPENVSIIYTDNSLNYLQFQILLAAQYRLSK